MVREAWGQRTPHSFIFLPFCLSIPESWVQPSTDEHLACHDRTPSLQSGMVSQGLVKGASQRRQRMLGAQKGWTICGLTVLRVGEDAAGGQDSGEDMIGDNSQAKCCLSVKMCSCVWVSSSETEWDPIFFFYSVCHMWGLCRGALQSEEPS